MYMRMRKARGVDVIERIEKSNWQRARARLTRILKETKRERQKIGHIRPKQDAAPR